MHQIANSIQKSERNKIKSTKPRREDFKSISKTDEVLESTINKKKLKR